MSEWIFLNRRGSAASAIIVAVLLLAGEVTAQPVPTRSVLPIREVVIQPIGTPRYVVTISINGAPIEAGLDTGSVGLRLLPRAVRRAGIAAGVQPDSFSYGSGVQLVGRRALADAAFGTIRGRIPLQAVETVSCVTGRECPGDRVQPQAFGLMGGGYPNQGFEAIIGARLATRATPNPFIALGVRRWIVHLPQRGGGGGGGALVLNPDAQDMAGFAPLRPGKGSPGTVGGCVSLALSQAQRICGPTLLDTGATELDVRGALRPPEWQAGRPGRLELVKSHAGAAGVAFQTGDAEHGARTMFVAPTGAGERPEISVGALPFYAFDVMYDMDSQTLAVRPNLSAGSTVHAVDY